MIRSGLHGFHRLSHYARLALPDELRYLFAIAFLLWLAQGADMRLGGVRLDLGLLLGWT